MFYEIIKREARICLLTARVVVRAGRPADTAKVDAQSDEASVVKCTGGAEDHFVVHRPAVQRVWVQDERNSTRRGRGCLCRRARLFQNRFEFAVRGGNKEIANRIQYCFHLNEYFARD
jgi:hypothetical protein